MGGYELSRQRRQLRAQGGRGLIEGDMCESSGEYGPVSSDVRYCRRSEHQLLMKAVSA